MCHVHSADRRRPGHLTGGVPVHSVGRQYAHAAACAALIMTRVYQGSCGGISTLYATDIMALGVHPDVTGISPWVHMSGLSILVRAPLSYKREGTRRYKADPTYALTLTQTHKFIQALKLNTSHSGVGYYAPAARTTLNPCVFLCSSRFQLAGKTLRPLFILGFRVGVFCHPAGEFLLRHLARQVGA
jgi:hypothetical protein